MTDRDFTHVHLMNRLILMLRLLLSRAEIEQPAMAIEDVRDTTNRCILAVLAAGLEGAPDGPTRKFRKQAAGRKTRYIWLPKKTRFTAAPLSPFTPYPD